MAAGFEARWAAFTRLVAEGDGASIRESSVPWPQLDARSLGLDPRFASPAAIKVNYHNAVRRWHPDKFVQSFGARLADDEREAILQRVKQVVQRITEIYNAQKQ